MAQIIQPQGIAPEIKVRKGTGGIWSKGLGAVGAVAGGVVGAIASGGNPAGALAGSSAGMGLGTGLGSFIDRPDQERVVSQGSPSVVGISPSGSSDAMLRRLQIQRENRLAALTQAEAALPELGTQAVQDFGPAIIQARILEQRRAGGMA
jgi:hypothetical protein